MYSTKFIFTDNSLLSDKFLKTKSFIKIKNLDVNKPVSEVALSKKLVKNLWAISVYDSSLTLASVILFLPDCIYLKYKFLFLFCVCFL